MSPSRDSMIGLYREAWRQLEIDRVACPEVEPEATPVLVFGQWPTARVATAGLNPSEDEFRTTARLGREPLGGSMRRFLHWDDGNLTESRQREALAKMERYFEPGGNAYRTWFRHYDCFLDALGATYSSGLSCHTDYLSPFATRVGVGQCRPVTVRALRCFGGPLWVRVLGSCPRLVMVVGHGAGWRVVPGLLGFAEWQLFRTRFDAKGKAPPPGASHMLCAEARLPGSLRRVSVYWWKPNHGGFPLCWLTNAERAELGALVRDHAASGGVRI